VPWLQLRCGRDRWDSGTRRGPICRRSRRHGSSPAFRGLARARATMTKRKAGSCCCTHQGRSPMQRRFRDWQLSAPYVNRPYSPPKQIRGPFSRRKVHESDSSTNSSAKRKNRARAMTSSNILYPPHQGFNLRLLDRNGATPYPRSHIWHSEGTIAKNIDQSALAGAEDPSQPQPTSKSGLQRNCHG